MHKTTGHPTGKLTERIGYNPFVKRLLHVVLGLSLGLSACAVAPLTPTPVVTATLPAVAVVRIPFTPLPTVTVTATPSTTPEPTATLVPPSATPAPVVVRAPATSALNMRPTTYAPAALPPLSAPPASGDAAAAEQYTIDLINQQRAANGLPPLLRDETLMGIARARVADMVARNYTGHNDPVTGASLGRALMRAAGYTSNFLGENWYGTINAPPAIVDIAMGWFMTDPPHARNILHSNYVYVGVGIAFNGRQWLLVQNFAGN